MRVRSALLGLVCGLWLLLLPVAIFVAAMVPDRPAGSLAWRDYILLADIFALPLACLLAPLAAWIAHHKGRARLAWGLAAIPLALLALAAAVFASLGDRAFGT